MTESGRAITIQAGVIVPASREAIEGCFSEIYSILPLIDPRQRRIFFNDFIKVGGTRIDPRQRRIFGEKPIEEASF